MPNQKKVWDAIAPEWSKFKRNADPENIKFIKNQIGKILDLGCASGRHFTKTKAEIYGVDFSPEMIKLAKKKAKELKIKKIKFAVAEAWKLPYEANFFDDCILINVLHCIPTKEKRQETLKEIFRVLKPKGKLRITVWNKKSGRFKKKKKEDTIKWRDKGERYYYFYDEDEIAKEIKKVGFKIISQSSTKNGIPHHSIIIVAEKTH